MIPFEGRIQCAPPLYHTLVKMERYPHPGLAFLSVPWPLDSVCVCVCVCVCNDRRYSKSSPQRVCGCVCVWPHFYP